jgi:hypothetical protein
MSRGGGARNLAGCGGSGMVAVSYLSDVQRGSGGCVSSWRCGYTLRWLHIFKSSGAFVA